MPPMNAKEKALHQRIEKTKSEIAALGDLRPGYLSQQFNVCGNPNCRCKADPPQRHGPYYQLGWTRNSKSTSRFVRKPHVSRVRREVKNYERMQALIDRWIELSIQLSDLRLKEGGKSASAKAGRA